MVKSNDLRHVKRHMASHPGEFTLDPQGTAPLHAISVAFPGRDAPSIVKTACP
jgi:hypothetical protein